MSKEFDVEFYEDMGWFWKKNGGADHTEHVYEPFGSFKTVENGKWIGIDNRVGDALVEEFGDEDKCDMWLRGEIEV